MKEFRDDCGRSWQIHLSCVALERIKAAVGFDFGDVGNGKAIELFAGDTRHLLDILWPLVQKDAESRQITRDSFGDGLRGDALDAAVRSLKEELLDFFPSARRGLMEKLLARVQVMVTEQQEKMSEEIANLRLVSANGGALLTSAPASSESGQTSGPSENSSPHAMPA